MKQDHITLTANNMRTFNLPINLSLLEISDETGRMYCTLWEPSDDLAQAALWESVRRWNREYGATALTAPSLKVKAWSS